MSKAAAPPEDRFWAKVDASGACWEWTGARMKKNGYGVFNLGPGEGTRLAHRYSYGLLVGCIPSGLQLDHLCRNRVCVCPEHLEPVTQAINLRRGAGPALTSFRRSGKPGNRRGSTPVGYVKRGRLYGERQPMAKLTWVAVDVIRREYAAGTATQLDLARRYGVSPRAIRLVINNETWKVPTQ